MKMLLKRFSAAALVMAALVSLTTLASSAGAAGDAWTGGPVTIRVELDLPSQRGGGPLVQQVEGVIPGSQVELVSTDIIDNPMEYCGTLWVDIDPIAKTVTVSTGQVPIDPDAEVDAPVSPVTGLQAGYAWDVCDFETANVTISGANFTSFTVVSDDLWEAELNDDDSDYAHMELAGPSLFEGDAQVDWASVYADPDATEGASLNLLEDGKAVFAYGLAPEETTTTTEAPTTTVAEQTTMTTTVPAAPVAPAAQPVQATPTYTG